MRAHRVRSWFDDRSVPRLAAAAESARAVAGARCGAAVRRPRGPRDRSGVRTATGAGPAGAISVRRRGLARTRNLDTSSGCVGVTVNTPPGRGRSPGSTPGRRGASTPRSSGPGSRLRMATPEDIYKFHVANLHNVKRASAGCGASSQDRDPRAGWCGRGGAHKTLCPTRRSEDRRGSREALYQQHGETSRSGAASSPRILIFNQWASGGQYWFQVSVGHSNGERAVRRLPPRGRNAPPLML